LTLIFLTAASCSLPWLIKDHTKVEKGVVEVDLIEVAEAFAVEEEDTMALVVVALEKDTVEVVETEEVGVVEGVVGAVGVDAVVLLTPSLPGT